MKKTFTVNLNQRVYHIDEDAYNMLSDYLESIKEVLAHEDSHDEIMADIENRIGEICNERISPNHLVITIHDISDIITQLGKPEQFNMDNDIDTNPTDVPPYPSDTDSTPSSALPPTPHQSKRLYRDMHNKMIGGVCSGISAYLDVDPTWIRLLFIGLAFLYGTTIIVYIILWAVIPPALNATSRLRMTGQAPTMENIGRTVSQVYSSALEKVNTPESKSILQKICGFFAVIFKAILILLLICAVPVLAMAIFCFIMAIIGIIAVFAGCFAGLATAIPFINDYNIHASNPIPGLIVMIGITITVGIPLVAIIVRIARGFFIKEKSSLSSASYITMLTLWGIGIALTWYGVMLCHNLY